MGTVPDVWVELGEFAYWYEGTLEGPVKNIKVKRARSHKIFAHSGKQFISIFKKATARRPIFDSVKSAIYKIHRSHPKKLSSVTNL
jgi:hypothetical protein